MTKSTTFQTTPNTGKFCVLIDENNRPASWGVVEAENAKRIKIKIASSTTPDHFEYALKNNKEFPVWMIPRSSFGHATAKQTLLSELADALFMIQEDLMALQLFVPDAPELSTRANALQTSLKLRELHAHQHPTPTENNLIPAITQKLISVLRLSAKILKHTGQPAPFTSSLLKIARLVLKAKPQGLVNARDNFNHQIRALHPSKMQNLNMVNQIQAPHPLAPSPVRFSAQLKEAIRPHQVIKSKPIQSHILLNDYNEALASLIHRAETSAPEEDRTGTGTWRIFGVHMDFDLSLGFPITTAKTINLEKVLGELRWFLSGEHTARILDKEGVKFWKPWTDYNKHPEGWVGEAYGHNWRHFGSPASCPTQGVDQIKNALDALRNNPTSRRIVVSAWNPQTSPDPDMCALPPCHTMFQLVSLAPSEADGKRRLCLAMYQRSGDFFLGIPFNIASYAALAHWFADATDHVAERLTITVADAHLYSNHLSAAKEYQRNVYFHDVISPTLQKDLSKECEFGLNYALEDYDPKGPIKAPISV